jgi:hypothetical protein
MIWHSEEVWAFWRFQAQIHGERWLTNKDTAA